MMMSLLFSVLVSVAYPQQIQTVPKTCNDLLPDMYEYIYFFEQVGDIWATQSPVKAQRIYDVLSIRRLYQETTSDYINPVDDKIKKYICDCYTDNKSELFTSDSKTIRTCLDKSIPKLIKESKKEYLTLKAKIKKDSNIMKLTLQQKQKISDLKKASFSKMEHELGKPSVN
jgi:hypothetical protein